MWLMETLIRRRDTASSLQARRLVSLKIRQHQSGILLPCQCTGRCSVRQHIIHGEQHDSYPMVFLMFIYMHTPCLTSSPLHTGLEPALTYCRGIQHVRLLFDSSLSAPMSPTETYTMEEQADVGLEGACRHKTETNYAANPRTTVTARLTLWNLTPRQ